MLARHGRRILNLLDDTPVVPGDTRPAFEHGAQARQVLNDAEDDLREWTPNLEPIPSNATEMGTNLMPASSASVSGTEVEGSVAGSTQGMLESAPEHGTVGGSSVAGHAEPASSYQ